MLPCKLCLSQGADKVSDIGLVAARCKIKQYCIVQDQSIISAYTLRCDRYLYLFLFRVLIDYMAKERKRGKEYQAAVSYRSCARAQSFRSEQCSLKGTLYGCYNIQQRIMAAN